MSAPLLTSEMAMEWMYDDDCGAPDLKFTNAMEAIADGRTRCVEVLSEDEHRARFEAWWATQNWASEIIRKEYEGVWMACARANGLVKEKKG